MRYALWERQQSEKPSNQMADQLGDDATWDDVMEKVRFRQAVEKGIRAADRGEFATQDEVKAAFKRWGVNVAD